MQDWHSTCLGRRTLPRDLSAFEIEAFFNFSEAERRVIEDRRGPALMSFGTVKYCGVGMDFRVG